MIESDLKAIEAQCSKVNGLAPVELSSVVVLNLVSEVRRLQSGNIALRGVVKANRELVEVLDKVRLLPGKWRAAIANYTGADREFWSNEALAIDEFAGDVEDALAAVRASREPAK